MTYSTVILDDRESYYNPYKADCGNCVHLNRADLTCGAFPEGIPVSLLSGDEKHREIRKRQKEGIIFKPKQ